MKTSVTPVTTMFLENLEKTYPGLYKQAVTHPGMAVDDANELIYKHFLSGSLNFNHICITCKSYLSKGKMPSISYNNNLKLSSEIKLTDLEACLIAQRILFLKMFQLPTSHWSAIKD